MNLTKVPTKCAKCGETKHPTKAYLALCKHYGEEWTCKACREKEPPPPMNLGKLGYLA